MGLVRSQSQSSISISTSRFSPPSPIPPHFHLVLHLQPQNIAAQVFIERKSQKNVIAIKPSPRQITVVSVQSARPTFPRCQRSQIYGHI
ncbi:hypothetical protein ACFX1Q_035066 [Malus domestica]